MRLFLLIIFCFIFSNSFAGNNLKQFRASNERSDTIDIIKTTIHFDLSNLTAFQIKGSCIVRFVSKMNNITGINFDLLKLPVDSVTNEFGQQLTFNYSDSQLLKINLTGALNLGDSSELTIFYHGHPQADASWGGFYFNPPYSYNLGVAFTSQPHNFGRVWFPCFDNFVERSLYEFYITVPTGKLATSNGLLIDTLNNGNNTTTWHWVLNETIPSYLACVSVCDYAFVKTTFSGLLGNVPVVLAARPTDTTSMKNSFVHLENAFDAFENRFGPYRWEKVGYSIVPFNGGAMEHATNISYPLFGITGSTTYESIMAHELSHHWFGDLVTCSTAEDMWLNEGWAVYCEHLFAEWMNGSQGYQDAVRANHHAVVHYSNLKDGGYHSLSGMPQNVTYGNTTYLKGADVAHTLRSYMGDSLFFNCLKNYLQDNQFTSKNSTQFRDYLENCSGINLHEFFNGWVFNPGFPQFSIETLSTTPNGGWTNVTVYIRQKLNHAPYYFNDVPVEITFMNNNWEVVTETVMVNGPCTIYSTSLPFNPVYAGLDLNQKISDSETDDIKTLKTTGAVNFVYGKMNLNVQTITDSAFVRIEHNYIYADGFKTPHPGMHISHERYWNVDGIFPNGFDAKASIFYNGTTPASVSTNSGAYLDDELITNNEDSIVLFYRANASFDWSLESDILLNTQGSSTNKSGQITINHLKKGQYALGIRQWNKLDSILPVASDTCSIVLNEPEKFNEIENEISIYPNPAYYSLYISGYRKTVSLIEIINSNGKIIESKMLNKGSDILEMKTKGWVNGIYFVKISQSGGNYILKKIVVMK